MTQRQKKRPRSAPGLPEVNIHVRCGCGQGYYLKRLDMELECSNCRWPVVWASRHEGSPIEWTLSRHISMTITRQT